MDGLIIPDRIVPDEILIRGMTFGQGAGTVDPVVRTPIPVESLAIRDQYISSKIRFQDQVIEDLVFRENIPEYPELIFDIAGIFRQPHGVVAVAEEIRKRGFVAVG